VNARDKTGETALFHAARGLFRAQNAQKRAKNTENGHKNTENGEKSAENGQKRVENGDLRLFSAQDGDFVSLFPADFSEIARILVENGAVLEMAGRNGLTAAEIAAGKGGKWCVFGVFWGVLGVENGCFGVFLG
jgi:ankyrin repeat protein